MAHHGDGDLDMGMDTVGLVQHTFHMYDGLVGNLGISDDHEDNDEPVLPEQFGGDGYGEESSARQAGECDRLGPDIEEDNVPVEEALEDDDLAAMEQEPLTQHQILEDSARTPLFAGSNLT